MRHYITYLLITLLAVFLPAGPGAMAQSNFSLEQSGNTFFIIRSSTEGTESVYYHTVDLSAIDGIHYLGIRGTCTFQEGETRKDFTVTENNNATGIYRFQTGTTREYRFELQNEYGRMITAKNREIPIGITIPTDYYDAKEVSLQPDEVSADDDGYAKNGGMQTICTDFFGNRTNRMNYLDYSSLVGNQLRMQLSFDAKEEDDSYQYMQILFDPLPITACDNREDCSNGDPGTPVLSSYMCGFEHEPKKKNTTSLKYSFPLLSKGNDCGPVAGAWSQYGNSVGKLDNQKFRSGSRADDGRLIVPQDFERIVLRLNASGSSGSDTWTASNGKAILQFADAAAPTVLSDGIRVSDGRHSKGSILYISIPFSEIVTLPPYEIFSFVYLSTSWGPLMCFWGNGTNVLTFCGDIDLSAEGTLRLQGYSQKCIKDLSGNYFAAPINYDTGLRLDPCLPYSITYDLDGGRLLEDNPDSYTFDSSVTIDKCPVKPGYAFAGWTGSNGTTPQKTIEISVGTGGNKHYTANWTPLWGQDRYGYGHGTSWQPYLISSTEGLDMLAKIVDGLDGYEVNDYSGQYFELENDLVYSTEGLGEKDSNFTPIGGNFNNSDKDFKGSFDGKGHTISGIRVYKENQNANGNKNQALFGRVANATVRNVTLSDARITGYRYVSGIVAICKKSEVGNCLVLNSKIEAWSNYGGVIVANNLNGSSLSGNYYNNCQVKVGNTVETTGAGAGGEEFSLDIEGARGIHVLTLAPNIRATGEGIERNGILYRAAGTLVSLEYDALPEGRRALFCCDGVMLMSQYFLMPAADAAVSVTLTDTNWSFSLAPGTRDGVHAWWGTFFDSTTDYLLSYGAAAYTMGSDYRLYRLGEDGRTIPRCTAVVIISTVPDATITPIETEIPEIEIHGGKNILIGTDEGNGFGAFMVLTTDSSGEVGFYKRDNIVLPPHKAGYLAPAAGGLQDYEKQSNQQW